MLPKIEQTRFVVDPFHTDFSGALNYETLGKHLLNAAESHACGRGFGMKAVNDASYTWVLSRLTVEMECMPSVYEPFVLSTWVENLYRTFTNRNYSIKSPDGKVYGYARSIWAMINYNTRQSADLEQLHGDAFAPYLCPDEPCPIDKPGRVRPLADDKFVATIDTHYSDIDYNGHVNSIKYIEHICNLFSLDHYRSYRLRRVEMAYMAESHFDDTLSFFMNQRDALTYEVEIRRNYVPNTDKGEAVVRCLLIFQ